MFYCIHCGSTLDAIPNIMHCPMCGESIYSYLRKEDDTTLKINRHELRILCMWASNWAARFPDDQPSKDAQKMLDAILKRIREQEAGKGLFLTLKEEIEDLKQTFGEENVEVIQKPGINKPSEN